jgi:hypothetical protein
MKKLIWIIALTVAFTSIGVALAAVGVEVDQAQAHFSANPTSEGTETTCVGEDAVTYDTVRGAEWKGTLTDDNAAFHDIPLSGNLTLKATITVNTTTGTGYATGTVTVKSSGQFILNKAPVTAVIQLTTGGVTDAAELRGLIDAPLYQDGQKTGDFLVANFEAKTNDAGHMTGQFGVGAGSHASLDYSIETTKLTC